VSKSSHRRPEIGDSVVVDVPVLPNNSRKRFLVTVFATVLNAYETTFGRTFDVRIEGVIAPENLGISGFHALMFQRGAVVRGVAEVEITAATPAGGW
jgi:hypothetical protein